MKCREIADYICKQLLEQGFIIHKYKAFSTCSIYLKLDYGACNSIRISDHRGYAHLSYKYCILQNCYRSSWVKNKAGDWQYFCQPKKEDIDKLIEIIIKDKQYKKCFYDYDKMVQEGKKVSKESNISFWRECEEVKL